MSQFVHTSYTRHLVIWNHIVKGLSGEHKFKFSNIVEMQGETESDTENISDGEEMTKNINNTRSETKFALVEDPLNIYRIASD